MGGIKRGREPCAPAAAMPRACLLYSSPRGESGGNNSFSTSWHEHCFPSNIRRNSRDAGASRGKRQGKMHSIKNREKVPKALTRFCQTGLATDDSCEDFSLLGNASRFVITGEWAAGKTQRTEQAQEGRALREP